MRKHVSTTRPTYLAAVLQDASKSYAAFLLLCTVRCGYTEASVLCPWLHVYVYDYVYESIRSFILNLSCGIFLISRNSKSLFASIIRSSTQITITIILSSPHYFHIHTVVSTSFYKTVLTSA